MDIVNISNLFNKIVQADADLVFYHFGFLDELDTSPDNNFNKGGINGRLYPSLDWTPPDFIDLNLDDQQKEVIKMDLYFSDLYGYNNKGGANSRSKIEVWRDLKAIVKRFLTVFNNSLCDGSAGGITSDVRLELDAGRNDKLIFIKVSFDLQINGDCVEDDGLEIPAELCDIENYCFCTEL